MKRTSGQITIFISLIMMCVFALFCGLVESARTAGARWYLQTAASSALDSVFSQYHRELWDSYRLLFAEYEDEEELEADFAAFLKPYLEEGKWYPMELEETTTEEWYTATDDNGTYLELEILDYMRYGIWDMDFEADTMEQLWDGVKEAGAVKNTAERYRGHAKEALKLEKALEAISDSQSRQQQKKEEGLSHLRSYDGSGFQRTAGELIRELERMPGLVAEYRRQADRLAANLRESRTVYSEEKSECSTMVQDQLEQEIRQYEAYVDEDGQRRKEIEALAAQSGNQIELIRNVIEEAKEVERIIEEWEDDDEDDDGPDLEALWSPVIRHFEGLLIHPLSFHHGVKDKEKEGWLNQVEHLYRSGMLKLVVPEGIEVSNGVLETEELPSQTEIMSNRARGISLSDHLLINEYCGKFFRCFRTGLSESGKEASSEQIGVPGTGGLSYEMEYLISGKDMDESNLEHVVYRLLAVREGLNLIYLMSDQRKREEAKALAMAITGITGLAPLVYLTSFFILSVWALGEALMDIRGLLAGKKIPLWKRAEDWSLGLEQLLSMGKDGQVTTGGGERGLSYLSWLKILLFVDDIVQQEYRMMDMIQMNIRRKQNAFRMRRGIYQARLRSKLTGKHVFFSLGFVEQISGQKEHTYPVEISVERVY